MAPLMSRVLSSRKLFPGWITTAVSTAMPTLGPLITPSPYSTMAALNFLQWGFSTPTLLMEALHAEKSLASL